MNTKQALEAIHQKLSEKGLTIATAESLTGGLIASTLASKSGASKYLKGGIVAYDLDAKADLLGVDRQEAQACDCVSEDVAIEMARGAQRKFDADCVVAVTGYAEPLGERPSFFHYAILCVEGDFMNICVGKVHNTGLSRNGFRKEIVRYTLSELANLLETV